MTVNDGPTGSYTATFGGGAETALRATPSVDVEKATLHNAMLAAGETNGSLARKLGVTEAVVRRLLDLGHRSHIGQVEQALELLGFRLVVSVARGV